MADFLLQALLGAVGAVAVSSAVASAYSLWSKRERERSETTTLDIKIDAAARLLSMASDAAEELDDEIEARRRAVEKLAEDARSAEALAQLHGDQVDAIKGLLSDEYAHSRRITFWQTVAISFVSFVLGVGATVLLT